MSQLEVTEGLLIGITTDRNKLKYPQWQFDLEGAKQLNPLLFKYKDQITAIKDLEYLENGEKETIKSIELSPYATEKECILTFFSSTIKGMVIGDSGIDVAGFQALIDKLCENQEFRKDYDELLQKSISASPKLALKYCGKKPLHIDEVSHIQQDEKGKVTETPLYTSSAPKEKQVCPFVKMGMARKKEVRGS